MRDSPESNVNHLALIDQKGKYQNVSNDICGSLWFQRYIEGSKIRMVQIWKLNKALLTCSF